MTSTRLAPTDTSASADLRHALRSEWIKLTSLRSCVAVVGALAVVLPLFAAVVAGTGSLQPDDTVLGASVLGGAVLAQLLAASLGAVSITSEYRSGTIRPTLLACPRPLTVLAAKSIVTSAVVAAVVAPATVASYLIGSLMLDDVYAQGRPFPAVVGLTLAICSMSVLGVGDSDRSHGTPPEPSPP